MKSRPRRRRCGPGRRVAANSSPWAGRPRGAAADAGVPGGEQVQRSTRDPRQVIGRGDEQDLRQVDRRPRRRHRGSACSARGPQAAPPTGVAEARRGSGLRTLASRNPLTIQPGARARAAAGGERQPRDHAEARGRLTNRHLPTPRHPTGRSLARPRRPAVRPRRSGCCAARSCPRGRRTRTAADRSSPWVTGSSRAGPRCWDR